jgi:tRNA A37 threonylcarbamoyladenosine synthetase subunit TsaC/SUA5/YrdC
MARCFDIHPASPQQHMIVQVADIVRTGGVIAYPTDSCYAPGCVDGVFRLTCAAESSVHAPVSVGPPGDFRGGAAGKAVR